MGSRSVIGSRPSRPSRPRPGHPCMGGLLESIPATARVWPRHLLAAGGYLNPESDPNRPLHRLEESRLVKARWVVTTKNRRARVYEITAAGRRHLEVEEKRWRRVTLAVGQLLQRI